MLIGGVSLDEDGTIGRFSAVAAFAPETGMAPDMARGSANGAEGEDMEEAGCDANMAEGCWEREDRSVPAKW